jgi:hypothetical protein
MTEEWVDFLLSEAVLTRLGVLDLRIIGNLARVKLPIIGIIRSALTWDRESCKLHSAQRSLHQGYSFFLPDEASNPPEN